MNCQKIYKVKTVKKPKMGYNSLWLIRCNICGKIVLRWDTDMYNKACPCCKNTPQEIQKRGKEEIKDSIFRIQRKLHSERHLNNIISGEEVSKLSSFRETEFESDLKDILSDYWLKTRTYTLHRRVEWKISKRGIQLIKNSEFIELLEECYNLLDCK